MLFFGQQKLFPGSPSMLVKSEQSLGAGPGKE